jgi:hypothetical protein
MKQHISGKQGRSAFKNLTRTLLVRDPLGRPRCTRVDNIRIHLKETCVNMRDWSDCENAPKEQMAYKMEYTVFNEHY